MRILIITTAYPPRVGGCEALCQDVVGGLLARGHAVRVLTVAGSTASGDPPFVERRLRDRFLDGYRSLQPRQIARHVVRCAADRMNAATAVRVARAFGADVVFLWQTGGGSARCLRALQRAGLPVVVELQDALPLDLVAPIDAEPQGWRRDLRRALYGIDAAAICGTAAIACSDELRRRYVAAGVPADVIAVVPNGVTIAGSPTDGAGECRRLLVVGRLHAQKGMHVAVRALARLNADVGGFTLDIIGPVHAHEGADPRYVAELRRLAAELGQAAAVRFVGAHSRDDTRACYAAYDLVLVPSLGCEPFGLVIVEAMAAGVPVVASRVGGPEEIIVDGESGVLVVPGDPAAMAAAIASLARDPRRRVAIAGRARAQAVEDFSLASCVQKIETRLRAVDGVGRGG